jgi:hypothetical protein
MAAFGESTQKPSRSHAKALLFVVSSLVGKRAYLAGPSRTETIAESMPINITHARTGATQSPALLNTFFDRGPDPALRV